MDYRAKQSTMLRITCFSEQGNYFFNLASQTTFKQ
jgi:hypothetical protein